MSRRTDIFRRLALAGLTAAVVGATLAPAAAGGAQGLVTEVARQAAPVVLEGRQLPTWSRLAAEGTPHPYPSGAMTTGDGVRDAHNGTIVVPEDPRGAGVPVEDIAAYRWDAEAGAFAEIPVQVDERFPYFLANGNSDFSTYSGTDEELSYVWDVEAWNRTAGDCFAEHPEGTDTFTPDPVPGLDDDDEIVFMADDAGAQAPDDAPGPAGSGESRQEILLADPLDPAALGYVYLFTKDGGSSFNEGTGYVHFSRDADADEYVDRRSFSDDDPEKLGSSNTGYGPNLSGTVCDTAADGTTSQRDSTDRFPRDGHEVRTDSYVLKASGRWMIREMKVAKPDGNGFGPDLIDRWKGRAFQQSPDSTISLVGFEDEQVNWEANAALLGWRTGPVRAIREVWGADSGTNVTKTELYYRDAAAYRYRVRVHPIPPDGLYTSWDYNHDVVGTYYNMAKPEGVPIDGVNDDVGNVDEIPVVGAPAFFDAPDPTFNVPSAFGTWEQVSGKGDAGSLVYTFELKGATTASNSAVVPYYRDDACLDDGTGDDPVARPWPGEASTDQRVRDGYVAAAGVASYDDLECTDRQGAFGAHGVHFFATHDSDNLFVGAPEPTTEIDGQQWQFAVPTAEPTNIGQAYANVVHAPLRPVAVEQANTPATSSKPNRG
jgi:hypothetical protein